MRDTDCFSEFTLGKLQVCAQENNAKLMISRDRRLVQAFRAGRCVWYWKYGNDLLVAVGGTYLTVDEVLRLCENYTDIASGVIRDAIVQLIDYFEDLLEQFGGQSE